MQNVQDKFQCMSEQIISRIDDMGTRIDDLEKSIAELMVNILCIRNLQFSRDINRICVSIHS